MFLRFFSFFSPSSFLEALFSAGNPAWKGLFVFFAPPLCTSTNRDCLTQKSTEPVVEQALLVNAYINFPPEMAAMRTPPETVPGDQKKKGETLAFLRPASPGDRCPRSDEPARSNNKKLNRWSEPEKTVGQKKKAPVLRTQELSAGVIRKFVGLTLAERLSGVKLRSSVLRFFQGLSGVIRHGKYVCTTRLHSRPDFTSFCFDYGYVAGRKNHLRNPV